MKKLLAYASLLVFSATVFAWGQSSPGLQRLQVPTAAQWNSYFSGKQDYLGYTPVNKAGDTMLGRLVTAPASVSSGFNLAPGGSPSSPLNGDLWSTTSGVFAYINGSTVSLGAAAGTVTAGGTLTNNQLVIGNGGSQINPLGSAGTGSQVLIGGGPPTWGSLNLATMAGASILPVANGGTNAASGSITAVNNISGRSYSGFTGTGNLMGSAAAAYSGTWTFNGSSSGVISFIGQAAAGTWNWEWPITAGLSGQVLTSAAGGGPMTWSTVATTGALWKYSSNSQSLSTSTHATLNIVNNVYDTASVCNTSTHVCTPAAGYYLVSCTVRIDSSAGPFAFGAIAEVDIYKNSTSVQAFQNSTQVALGAQASSGWANVETVVQLNGSDTVSCNVYSDGATGPTVQNSGFAGAFIHA